MVTVLTALLAFGLSFLFALGGVGSAIVLVPVLHGLGVPLVEAKPTGLFVNTVSLMGASVSNLRNRKLDTAAGLPIIAASVCLAPIGAWASTFMPERGVLMIFVGFLFFSGTMMLVFKSGRYAEQYRTDRPLFALIGIGGAAGMLSGLLGVGGGGLVSPLMILLGFNPKRVAAITAFVVPFSSLTGFIAYWILGHFDPALVLPVGGAAWLGGYLGTCFMQARLSPAAVKRFLALVVLGLGVKMLFKVL